MELSEAAGALADVEEFGKEESKAPKLKGSDETAGAGLGAGAGAGIVLLLLASPNAPKAKGSAKFEAGAGAETGAEDDAPKASKLGASGAGAGD